MSALSLSLTFEHHKVRMVGTPERPLWIAKDVCRVLDIHNSRDALYRAGVSADERVSVSTDTLGGPQDVTAVTEPGLWKLVLISRKASAQRFKGWLATEVLPSIRQHGCYPPPTTPGLPAAIDFDDPKQLRGMVEGLALRRLGDLQLIAELKPKAEHYDAVLAADDTLSVAEVANILARPSRPLGQNRLFGFLHDDGILLPSGRPDQRYVEAGYLTVREQTFKDTKGRTRVHPQVRIHTPRGVDFIRRRLDSANGQGSLLPSRVRAVTPTPRELN